MICNIHISIHDITLIHIPIFISLISSLYHPIIHIVTQTIKVTKTVAQIIAQIILIFLFFITGILRFCIYTFVESKLYLPNR